MQNQSIFNVKKISNYKKTDTKSDPKKFDYIDALRGITILLVLLHHMPQEWQSMQVYLGESLFTAYDALITYSAHGVQLFYIVSAFTLYHSLFSRKESFARIKFFPRRFFRIAPLLYFYLVLIAGGSDKY